MNISILIPCYNEEKTIAKVVSDCKKYIPEANIYVYDNNSTDKTIQMAQKAGAIVHKETMQGKGNVVRRMFADIDADIYVMIDGDATYDVSSIPNLIKILKEENLDMVVGARKEAGENCYRIGHRFGNKVLTKLVEVFLQYKLQDMLSGLRVFSKRYVKTFPAESRGFEIETELTVYALSRRLPIKEVQTKYFSRPQGSYSKLSTYKDGSQILKTIALLIKEERPLLFFSIVAFIIFVIGLGLAVPIFIEFKNTGLVPRFPTAILASSLMVCSLISFFIGVVLDTVVAAKKEISRAIYLRYK